MDEVELTLPAKAEFLHLMRSVVASVGARRDLSIDDIDDLRIAVDEAGSYLLAHALGTSRLQLKVSANGDDVSVVIWLDVSGIAWPPSGGEEGLAWKVMSGLADRAEFVIEDGSVGIKLTKISARSANV